MSIVARPAPRRLYFSCALLAAVLLTACACLLPARRAARAQTDSGRAAVTETGQTLASAYGAQDWEAVRAVFANQKLASALVERMRVWRSEDVQLRVAAASYVRKSPYRAAAALEFYDDPRVTPEYQVYLFGLPRGRILGLATGLTGESYRTVHWSVARSAHFTVYFSPYERLDTVQSGLAGLEQQRAHFIQRFGVQPPARAVYYLYPSVSVMAQLTGNGCGSNSDNLGCTDPFSDPPTIHTVLWPTYHEPIHVYERALEPAPQGKDVLVAPLFIAEGTAVALEDESLDPNLSDYCSDLSYAPLNLCARYAARRVQAISLLPDSGFKRAVPGEAYATGGSFVRYLIIHYGYHAFRTFYYTLAAQPTDTVRDYNVAARAAYGETIERLLQAWHTDLCAGGGC